MIPPIDQFANTLQEWHYLTAGLAIGTALGYILRDTVIEYVEGRYE